MSVFIHSTLLANVSIPLLYTHTQQVATTGAAAAAMGAGGAKGPNHSLYTPPERVPVLSDAGASHYQGEIARLVHKNR